jgi:putative transcriptional regulator
MKLRGRCLDFRGCRRDEGYTSTRRIFGWRAAILACLVLLLSAPFAHGAQRSNRKVVLLVARSEVRDPFFRQSVVLMLPLARGPLVVGVIVNKPTKVQLGRLFPENLAAENRSELAYFGGPVDVAVASVVFRSETAPKNALHLYNKVYLTFDAGLIDSYLKKPERSSTLRLFLGRAQWAPEQLKDEFSRGGWYRMEADGDLVFTSDPNSLWRDLHTQATPGKYVKDIVRGNDNSPGERD